MHFKNVKSERHEHGLMGKRRATSLTGSTQGICNFWNHGDLRIP